MKTINEICTMFEMALDSGKAIDSDVITKVIGSALLAVETNNKQALLACWAAAKSLTDDAFVTEMAGKIWDAAHA